MEGCTIIPSLERYILSQFQNKDTSDTDIVITMYDGREKIMHVHKLVLQQCLYFMGMFRKYGFSESRGAVITTVLDGQMYDDRCIDIFFTMLYANDLSCVKGIDEYCIHIHSLCVMYQFKRGEDYCLDIMRDHIDVEFIEILQYGLETGYQAVIDICVRWLEVFCPNRPDSEEIFYSVPFHLARRAVLSKSFFGKDELRFRLAELIDRNNNIEPMTTPCTLTHRGYGSPTVIKFTSYIFEGSGHTFPTIHVTDKSDGIKWHDMNWRLVLFRLDPFGWHLGIHTSFDGLWLFGSKNVDINVNIKVIGLKRTIIHNENMTISINGLRKDTDRISKIELEDPFVIGKHLDKNAISGLDLGKSADGTKVLFVLIELTLVN